MKASQRLQQIKTRGYASILRDESNLDQPSFRTKEVANQRSVLMEAGAKIKLMGKATKSKETGKRSLYATLSHYSVNVTTNTYETKKDVKTRIRVQNTR